MKALILFISAAFLISTITCEPCGDSYDFADASINSLKNNFFTNRFESMYEDFESIMKSAELIQDACDSSVDFSIQVNQFYTCSLVYSVLTELLDNYRFESENQMRTVLGQIVSLIPTIEEKFCLDEWEMTTLQNQQLDDDFWLDNDSSDDYSYDTTDNDFMVEDEEDEDTGDDISAVSDDDESNEDAGDVTDSEDEEKIVIIDWTVMQEQQEDSDDEGEEEEGLIGQAEIEEDVSVMVYVEMSHESEGDVNVIVADESIETADIFVESEDHLTASLDCLPLTKEDEDMIMVFGDITNMKDTETELEMEMNLEAGEDSLSMYIDMSGELFLEDNSEDSVFVYVDAYDAAAIDQLVNSIFADEESDMDVIIGELDLQKFWGDDEEEEESFGDY